MKSSAYCFHMKTKILADFQICISVPLIWNKLIKPQKRQLWNDTLFFIAVNNFWLGLKTSHQTVLHTCRLSTSDRKISPFWFSPPRLLVSANNFPVFEKISDAPRQNSSSQIIRNTPLDLCFVTVSFFNFF